MTEKKLPKPYGLLDRHREFFINLYCDEWYSQNVTIRQTMSVPDPLLAL